MIWIPLSSTQGNLATENVARFFCFWGACRQSVGKLDPLRSTLTSVSHWPTRWFCSPRGRREAPREVSVPARSGAHDSLVAVKRSPECKDTVHRLRSRGTRCLAALRAVGDLVRLDRWTERWRARANLYDQPFPGQRQLRGRDQDRREHTLSHTVGASDPFGALA